MNFPPDAFICVPHLKLHAFVSRAAQTVGMPPEKAELLASLLTDNDLRGVFSHGTCQIATYALHMRDGQLNPDPQVKVVRETPTSVLLDGDGGLGYFAAYRGAQMAIEKAKQQGVAVAATTNHGHFGAAGIYARLPLEHGLLTFVTSGHQLHLSPDQPVTRAAGGSPMAFSAPAGEEDDLVLDFGTVHDLHRASVREELLRTAPGIVFRSLGMGNICQVWGGLLTGIPLDAGRAERRWPGANQGSLLFTFRVDLFLPLQQFMREMDEYVRAVRALQPLPGFDQAYLPGGLEAARVRQYRREGIPVGRWHQQQLEELAGQLGLQVPWENNREA